MRRFLAEPNHQVPDGRILRRRRLESLPPSETSVTTGERCLLLTYSAPVRDEFEVRHALFACLRTSDRQTLVHLIHLTNNGLGMRQMKRA